MTLEEFHQNFRSDLKKTIAERVAGTGGNGGGYDPFPAEELVFAEMVTEHIAEAGICDDPTPCHWMGQIGNAKLRITGYALSADETALDLFVTHYFGSDGLTELKDAEASSTAAEGVRFLFEVARGRLESRVDPIHPVRDLVALLRSRWSEIDRLRVFVITDGRTKTKRFSNKEVQGKMVAIEAMDMERLFRHTEGKPRDELAVSFTQTIGRPLPCVHVPDPDADYEYVLTAIPGQLLRDLYLRFGSRLLEANVRTFLGSKKPANRGILETLRKEPEHFLAFNNGLVIVCDEASFERTADGYVGLSFLKGLQIVNGGQTTSSIYFASRDDRTIDLSHVMVPAKIIILKGSNDEARDRLISDVSKYANSQTAVKFSDLSANRPFHVQFEKLAHDTWCPDGYTRWFYERAAGAYNVMLLRDAKTPAQRLKIQATNPPKMKLSKEDLAKYHEAWRVMPKQVASGRAKNFAAFMKAVDEDPTIIPNVLDAKWYRAMIAKVILHREIEAAIKTKEAKQIFTGGWSQIATHVVSLVAENIGEKLDLEQIWAKQGISNPLRELLYSWATVVNSEFARLAPGRPIQDEAKISGYWEKIRVAKLPAPNPQIPEIRT